MITCINFFRVYSPTYMMYPKQTANGKACNKLKNSTLWDGWLKVITHFRYSRSYDWGVEFSDQIFCVSGHKIILWPKSDHIFCVSCHKKMWPVSKLFCDRSPNAITTNLACHISWSHHPPSRHRPPNNQTDRLQTTKNTNFHQKLSFFVVLRRKSHQIAGGIHPSKM